MGVNRNILKLMALLLFSVLFVLELMSANDGVRWLSEVVLGAFVMFLLFSEPEKTPEPVVSEPEVANAPPLEVVNAINELSETLAYEAVIIDQEVDRVETLIKDAVVILSESFNEIVDLLESKEFKMVVTESELESVQSSIEDTIQTSAMSLEERNNQVSVAIGNAVRSLQFEDMSIQAVRSIHHNINTINEVSRLLSKLLGTDGSINQSIAKELHCVCIELRTAAEKRNAGRTVSQQGMDEGDIELF